jgi:hypothetical protein
VATQLAITRRRSTSYARIDRPFQSLFWTHTANVGQVLSGIGAKMKLTKIDCTMDRRAPVAARQDGALSPARCDQWLLGEDFECTAHLDPVEAAVYGREGRYGRRAHERKRQRPDVIVDHIEL